MADNLITLSFDNSQILLDVNGITYDIVEEGDGDNVWLEWKNDIIRFSYTDFVNHRIYIHKFLKKKRKYRVLMSELTRVILRELIPGNSPIFGVDEICSFVELYGEQIMKARENYSVFVLSREMAKANAQMKEFEDEGE